jgi:uncharacterized Zn finger protein
MELQEDQEKAIKDFCNEMSASFLRKEAESDFQRGAINLLHEKIGIEKKYLRKMARTFHKQNFQEETETSEEFAKIYKTVFGDETPDGNE